VLARLDHLRGVLELRAGRLAAGYRILSNGAAAFAQVAPDSAAAMLADASLAASYDADLANVVAAGELAERLWADATPPPAARSSPALRACSAAKARRRPPCSRPRSTARGPRATRTT
jgi:hypothetical protein